MKSLAWKEELKLSISSNICYVTECIELGIQERKYFFFLMQDVATMTFIKKLRKGINKMYLLKHSEYSDGLVKYFQCSDQEQCNMVRV